MDEKLQQLYGDRSPQVAASIRELLERRRHAAARNDSDESPTESLQRWSQRDVVLITYGDQVKPDFQVGQEANQSRTALQTLFQFLDQHGLFDRLSTVHFLPCFPYSSDDGFSVIDYRAVDPELGSWDDVHLFRDRGSVMLDFVCNHISQHSEWFQRYRQGDPDYANFFIEAEPNDERLQQVTRPRSLPLLTPVETSRGEKHVWTTFSDDQIDLNYAEPAVLLEVLDILLEYVQHGARIIRLDAIAYLWKELGTTCIHLENTHVVVKLMREVLEQFAPDVLVLTETNVPHKENVSYFGNGDEAHMVYQFSLPPLLLDAFLNEDAVPLKTWLAGLEAPPVGATYFNFTASHDGVGVRPLEGLVDDARRDRLVEKIRARGGRVNMRRNPDGTDSPYEMNIAYVDAVRPEADDLAAGDCDAANESAESVLRALHAQRFLASQAVMMALQGMPAVYFHSLVGTQNDYAGVEASGGINRRINRRKFTLSELTQRLDDETSLQGVIFAGMQQLLEVRTAQPAFHPDAAQIYIETQHGNLLAFERVATSQSILVVVNFGREPTEFSVPESYHGAVNLLSSATGQPEVDESVNLLPAEVVWLSKAT